jgi:hypothetical protein
VGIRAPAARIARPQGARAGKWGLGGSRRRDLTLRCLGRFRDAIGVCAAKVVEMAVIAELQAHDVERPGERLQLRVEMNRAVLIDPQTELVL